MKNNTKKITIYTDGACKGNPGIGGWGAIMMCGEHKKEIYGGEAQTTNNRMELKAAIEALKLIKNISTIEIYTDSKYVLNGITSWIDKWISNGWKTAARKDIKNQDLWQELNTARSSHNINWVWVKGHSNDEYNDRADFLANKGIEQLK